MSCSALRWLRLGQELVLSGIATTPLPSSCRSTTRAWAQPNPIVAIQPSSPNLPHCVSIARPPFPQAPRQCAVLHRGFSAAFTRRRGTCPEEFDGDPNCLAARRSLRSGALSRAPLRRLRLAANRSIALLFGRRGRRSATGWNQRRIRVERAGIITAILSHPALENLF